MRTIYRASIQSLRTTRASRSGLSLYCVPPESRAAYEKSRYARDWFPPASSICILIAAGKSFQTRRLIRAIRSTRSLSRFDAYGRATISVINDSPSAPGSEHNACPGGAETCTGLRYLAGAGLFAYTEIYRERPLQSLRKQRGVHLGRVRLQTCPNTPARCRCKRV